MKEDRVFSATIPMASFLKVGKNCRIFPKDVLLPALTYAIENNLGIPVFLSTHAGYSESVSPYSIVGKMTGFSVCGDHIAILIDTDLVSSAVIDTMSKIGGKCYPVGRMSFKDDLDGTVTVTELELEGLSLDDPKYLL